MNITDQTDYSPTAGTSDHPDRFLARVFDFASEPLPPFDHAPFDGLDRSAAETLALAAAAGCPDLFLIDAGGPGRLGLIIDLAVATRGRVLIVASPYAADQLVGRLASTEHVGRAVAPDERPDRLPPVSAARTSAAHGDGAVATAKRKVATAVTEAEGRVARLTTVPALVDVIRTHLHRLGELTEQEAAIRRERDVEAVSPEDVKTRHAAALTEQDATIAARQSEADTLRAALDEAIAAAKKAHGVVGFLKGLFGKDDPAARCAELQHKLGVAEQSHRDAIAARAAVEQAQRDEVAAILRDETARRHAAADERLAELNRERETVNAQIQDSLARLAVAGFTVTEPLTADTLTRVVEEAAVARREAEAELGFAREWATDLTARPAAVAARFLTGVRVVVSTPAAIAVDPLVAGEFDRLLVVDAEHVGEPEFLMAARKAQRWVMIGDPRSGPPRNGKPAPRPLFHRLWQRLHQPTWITESGRLVARLAQANQRLRAEPLADRPDVVLRFADGPDGEVLLAEVVFPLGTEAAAAKAFLASELGEVRLSPCGPVHWHDGDQLTACWPAVDVASRPTAWVDLEPGVREKIVGCGSDVLTAAVEFDPAAGWTRATAEEWIERHTTPARAIRSAVVPRPASPTVPDAPSRVVAGVGG